MVVGYRREFDLGDVLYAAGIGPILDWESYAIPTGGSMLPRAASYSILTEVTAGAGGASVAFE